MKTIAFDDLSGLRAEVCDTYGEWGDPVVVDQAMIDEFARVTGDHQWIHTDVERAAAESPFGTTIAHGFLTLSLLPRLAPPLPFEIVGYGNATIFGIDNVRFARPVPAGSRIRARHRLAHVRAFSAGTLLQSETQIGVEGVARPAVRFELRTLYQPAAG